MTKNEIIEKIRKYQHYIPMNVRNAIYHTNFNGKEWIPSKVKKEDLQFCLYQVLMGVDQLGNGEKVW